MASPDENLSMALFCDFENVALGVRDANYDKFDIKPVLERLLLKGSIVVKKAYCDWERYKGFKATMHEANFELIEIPHVRQSGKNSADIRLVVDALDLCYTKSHVNTFVIISGDSDFSPLVSKLRENAKQVIGVGVKQSTSDLLIANCDEFIFYDDLVRESRRTAARRGTREAAPAVKRTPDEDKRRKEETEARKSQAIEIAVETFDALASERGDSGKIWASVLKEAIKRRKPDFNESYFGFRAFGNLLEEAQTRGLLDVGRDEKSGAYVYRSHGRAAGGEGVSEPLATMSPVAAPEVASAPTAEASGGKQDGRRKGRGGRKSGKSADATIPLRDEALAQREETLAQREETSAQRAETSAQRDETSAQREETSPQRDEALAQQPESSSAAGEAAHRQELVSPPPAPMESAGAAPAAFPQPQPEPTVSPQRGRSAPRRERASKQRERAVPTPQPAPPAVAVPASAVPPAETAARPKPASRRRTRKPEVAPGSAE